MAGAEVGSSNRSVELLLVVEDSRVKIQEGPVHVLDTVSVKGGLFL